MAFSQNEPKSKENPSGSRSREASAGRTNDPLRCGILAIEQPELHVHPAIQVGLGDLFIEAVQTREGWVGTRKTLLIETHSEHIMLRLLRRIRETTEKELPPGVVGLSANDLSVIYVESADGVVRLKRSSRRFWPLRARTRANSFWEVRYLSARSCPSGRQRSSYYLPRLLPRDGNGPRRSSIGTILLRR